MGCNNVAISIKISLCRRLYVRVSESVCSNVVRVCVFFFFIIAEYGVGADVPEVLYADR